MKELITTFATIFIAEVADKTQFAVISFTVRGFNPVSVWLGATLAFCVTNLLGVLLGFTVSKFLPPEVLKYVSGCVFIIVGILTIFSR